MEQQNNNQLNQSSNKPQPKQDSQQNQDGQAKSQESSQEPDVVLDVPRLKVDEISLNVDDLHAKVSLSAKLADFVQIDVGADVHIEKVDVNILGVEAEAHLRVRLNQVKQILNRTIDMIDNNPDLIKSILQPVSEGAGKAAGEMGEGAGGGGDGMVKNAVKGGGEKIVEAAKNIGDKISDVTTGSDEEKDGANTEEQEEISANTETKMQNNQGGNKSEK